VDDLADKLQKDGISALPYHAGLASDIRSKNQEKFIKDDVEIIVATIAFGMGIDKPNVRYVIHCDMPKSIEGYYQETGRAGRDGLKSDCILFFSYADKIKHEYFIKQIEDEQYRKIAYEKMWAMINFCKNKSCRRKILLNYFGEKYSAHNCNMCDVCSPTRISFDSTKFNQGLFEVLRKLRKEIADEKKVPPYIVFSDVVLKEMAAQYPQNIDGFRKINGVGEVKLAKYGKLFIEKIIGYCNTSTPLF